MTFFVSLHGRSGTHAVASDDASNVANLNARVLHSF